MIEFHHGDAVQWAKDYDGPLFHALLSDPPYHLTGITQRFGKKTSKPAKAGKDGAFARASRGFMGQQWDGGDVAFRPETWAAFMKVLHPGAFGASFASARGWHRMAAAIEGLVTLKPNQLLQQADLLAMAREKRDWTLVEDVENNLRTLAGIEHALQEAGFIVHPTIFLWVRGGTMPKATNITKNLDKGQAREIIGEKIHHGHNAGTGAGSFSKNRFEGQTGQKKTETLYAPASEMSARWVGHRYGAQALKPAVEPVILFQKPYAGRPLDNITQTGAGALNIEATRFGDAPMKINRWQDDAHPFGGGAGNEYESVDSVGRWPSNFILDSDAAARLDEQSGILQSGAPQGVRHAQHQNIYGKYQTGKPITGFADEGGASRFFYTIQAALDEADPVYYCGKASGSEKDAGLESLPDIVIDDGRPTPIDNPYQRGKTHRKNPHPTLKPLDLCRYLAALLLPPPEYTPRRLFVPFSGTGSECIGGHLAGWEEIEGVELGQEYINVAELRKAYWCQPVALELFARKAVQNDLK